MRMNQKRLASFAICIALTACQPTELSPVSSTLPAPTASVQKPAVNPTVPTPAQSAMPQIPPSSAPTSAATQVIKGRADLFGVPFSGAEIQVFRLGYSAVIARGVTASDGHFTIDMSAVKLTEGSLLKFTATRGQETLTSIAPYKPVTENLQVSLTFGEVILNFYTTLSSLMMADRLNGVGQATLLQNGDIIAPAIQNALTAFSDLVDVLSQELSSSESTSFQAQLLQLPVGSTGEDIGEDVVNLISSFVPPLGTEFQEAAQALGDAIAQAIDAGGLIPSTGTGTLNFGAFQSMPMDNIVSSGSSGVLPIGADLEAHVDVTDGEVGAIGSDDDDEPTPP